jgi:Protein of unknown function (DUF1566)
MPTTAAAARRSLLAVLAAASLLGASAGWAHTLTPASCLAQKRKAWTALRKCEGNAEAKRLLGKPFDLEKCRTKLDLALAKISEKAAAAEVSCRYGDNADGTLTDYDTALQWELKHGEICVIPDLQCWFGLFTWSGGDDFQAESQQFVSALSGMRRLDDPTLLSLAGHSDWRLPTIDELTSILDLDAPGCGSGGACIDPSFGFTSLGRYWSITTLSTQVGQAFFVDFGSGDVSAFGKIGEVYLRGVRRAF